MDTFRVPDPQLHDPAGGTTPRSGSLDIGVEGSQDLVRIQLHGELDMLTAPELSDALDQIRAWAPRRLRFDMAELSFMDRAGLAAISAASRTAGGSEISVAGCRDHVRLVFELTGHSDLIEDRDGSG